MASTTIDQLQPLLPLLARKIGHRPSPATVWRWKTHGIKVGDRRVKLRATKIGGKLHATPADIQRFIDEQNPPTADVDDEESERSPEAKRRLEAAGLLYGEDTGRTWPESGSGPLCPVGGGNPVSCGEEGTESYPVTDRPLSM